MLEVNNLMVFFENALALNDITIEVKEGEIVGVLGSNSAGKTTLMNTISGLIIDMKIKEDRRGHENSYNRKVSELKHRRVLFGYPSKTMLLKTQARLMSKKGKKELNDMLAKSKEMNRLGRTESKMQRIARARKGFREKKFFTIHTSFYLNIYYNYLTLQNNVLELYFNSFYKLSFIYLF